MSKVSSEKTHLIKDINLSSLGWELALPIFICTLIGYLIDRQVASNHFVVIGFILLGIGIGYYNIYKYAEIEMLRLKKSRRDNGVERHS